MTFANIVTALRLEDLGYSQFRTHSYRAGWSTDEVEHFLYLKESSAKGNLLDIEYGLRNSAAQSFAVDTIKLLGGELYTSSLHVDSATCLLRFSVNRYLAWGAPLMSAEQVSPALGREITAQISRQLLPELERISDIGRYLSEIEKDSRLLPWPATNAAIRAAQIIYLSKCLNVPRSEILTKLAGRERAIRGQLGPGSEASDFIRAAIDLCSLPSRGSLN